MRYIIACILLLNFQAINCLASSDTSSNLATEKQLLWLKSSVFPLNSVEMNSDDSDLRLLDSIVVGKSVVALGEVSHGASDIFRIKGKIIKHLVTNDSFTVFAIEANMPEAYRLNDYVINGIGNPKELIKGMLFWTWDTQEMLDIVEWIRNYNKYHSRKVSFIGFDIQSYKGSITAILRLLNKYHADSVFNLMELSANLAYIDSVKKVHFQTYKIKPPKIYRKYFSRQFHALRSFAIQNIHDSIDYKFFMLYIRNLEQYTLCFTPPLRDEFMAENFLWIRNYYKHQKVIIWAHNGHICKQWALSSYPMGYHLAQQLRNEYLSLGFAYHEGLFTANGKDGIKTYNAQKSYIGTYEYYFHSIGIPLFLLDLRYIIKDASDSKWLCQEHLFRCTGAQPMPQEFLQTRLVGSFDLLIYLESTRPSVLLNIY